MSMEEKKEKKLTIYSYRKLWKFERKIYSFQNVKFIAPIDINSALYFMLALGVMFLLNKLPVVAGIPFVIKWVVLPYGFMKFIETVKLDGKNPILYIAGCIRYWLVEQGMFIEHFKSYPVKQKPLRLSWYSGIKRADRKEGDR